MSSFTEIQEIIKTFDLETLRQLFSDSTIVYPAINGHILKFDLSDPDEYFLQKAREELREIPEITAQSLKELKELLAGKERSIVHMIVDMQNLAVNRKTIRRIIIARPEKVLKKFKVDKIMRVT